MNARCRGSVPQAALSGDAGRPKDDGGNATKSLKRMLLDGPCDTFADCAEVEADYSLRLNSEFLRFADTSR